MFLMFALVLFYIFGEVVSTMRKSKKQVTWNEPKRKEKKKGSKKKFQESNGAQMSMPPKDEKAII